MPASENRQGQRALRLAPALFWCGVALAPIAALLMLIAHSSGPLRLAAALAVLAVILVGLSMALRPDAESVRDELEQLVFDEIDALREDVREDITVAARATHKAFGERVTALHESVEALRSQVEYLRTQVDRTGGPPATGHPAGRQAAAAPGAVTDTGSIPRHRGGGLVRHTETVQVTTRQTIVDQNESRSGRVYGSSRAVEPAPAQRSGEWTPTAAPRDEPATESWTEQLLRGRLSNNHVGDYTTDRLGAHAAEHPPNRGGERESERAGGRRRAYDPDDGDDRITGVRAGDRWASVRTDERGRELRMGERRTAMDADDRGTEVRIEDRWAAVRRAEDRHDDRGRGWDRERERDRERSHDDEDGRRRHARGDEWTTERRSQPAQPPSWAQLAQPDPWAQAAQPALPAASYEPAPAYVRQWSPPSESLPERVPEPRSRHADDRTDPYGWNNGDERWR